MKIYITGCARSGTTLLQYFFFAFKDVEVIEGEINLDNFIAQKPRKRILVGKRTWNTIFSTHRIDDDEMYRQAELIKGNDIKIINIVRDGRDVIESGYVPCERWIKCMEALETRFRNKAITMMIRYEGLVNNPDGEQHYIARTFDLHAKHRFSEYPKFVPDALFEKEEDPAYKKRPISKDRIGKDLELYKTKCPELKDEFEKYLRTMLYI